MKHLKIKTKLFQRAALTLLLAVAGISNASAGADFFGNSAIDVNGTWYYCGNQLDWCNGGKFNTANLGTISKLELGAQTQIWTSGDAEWNHESVIQMNYIIDGGTKHEIDLTYWKFESHNNFFQSGGTSVVLTPVDISGLQPGTHTIAVYFDSYEEDYDPINAVKNSDYYVATFTIGGDISVAAKQAPDNNYWTTFYCGNAKYAINSNENACAYTATVSGATITLHKLGKVIPDKTAVIIVGQDNSIGMSTSSASVENNVSNNLHGLDLAKPASTVITYYQGATTIYMLSNKNDNFGFHDLGTSTTVPASKAFLALDDNDGARSRGFTIEFDDDGTTGIRTIDNGLTENDSWYSLDGRKFNGKPTAKGVYINNGKKIIIK